MKLNVGSGTVILDPKEWINIDKNNEDPRAFKLDVETLTYLPYYVFSGNIPEHGKFLMETFKDITEIRAHHVLEHIDNLDAVMKWFHDICVNGAVIDIIVPLANTLWDCGNPDHKRKFNHKTFLYYTRDFITSDIGLFRGFDLVSQHLEREKDEWFEGVSWIVANLHIKLKVVK